VVNPPFASKVLPVDEVLPDLVRALRDSGHAVLQAPPGAGKTTRVPLALLRESWVTGRIVMLEPRRLAARAAARYLARQLGEEVGETVGYRMRLDTRVSPSTRIEVVTEGVLTRMLQSDPALEGVSVVIFDEFHERSLHADVGLALTLQSRALLRDDLRLLVMSATLEAERVAEHLGGAPLIASSGRSYPVETHFLHRALDGQVVPAVVRTIVRVLSETEGDLLVFLPGAAEIQRAHDALSSELPSESRVDLHPLFGNLAADAQDRAIAPSPPGRRKVVLATSIAETSLTIEGVRVVVDSGLMRVPRWSARTGMARLETVPVTRASADQRRGRAGRTSAGVCYRLWTEAQHTTLRAHGDPEITQADLAPLALDLATWGVREPGELRWLDPPPAASYAQARELLVELGALDGAAALTTHGRELARLALHPRLGHMLLRGVGMRAGALAAEIAALLGERDLLKGVTDPDIGLRLLALKRGAPALDRAAAQRVQSEVRELQRQLKITGAVSSYDDAGLLLALAYPDRIGQKRAGSRGRFLLRNGRGVVLDPASSLGAAEYIVAAQVDDRGAEGRVFLGAALERADLEQHFADQIQTDREVVWDGDRRKARAYERSRLGAIVIAERPVEPTADEIASGRRDWMKRMGIAALPWSERATELRQRLAFLHQVEPDWPDVSDASLLDALDETGDVLRTMESLLHWQQRARLDELAPTHIVVPSGSHLPIDYSDPTAPVLAVRLQEVFGWRDTPRIANGKVPLTLQLLSPAQRPVQVTRDLASFWRTGYFEVKKDLKGRYPRHYWPDDPLTATPTRRVRPRSEGKKE
jgi:ATP-dependent helicase HrpB